MRFLAGELYVSPRVALHALHEVVEHPTAHSNAANLTDRELHVFALTGAGFGPRRIAQELGISPKRWKPITNTSSSSWDTLTPIRCTKARESGLS